MPSMAPARDAGAAARRCACWQLPGIERHPACTGGPRPGARAARAGPHTPTCSMARRGSASVRRALAFAAALLAEGGAGAPTAVRERVLRRHAPGPDLGERRRARRRCSSRTSRSRSSRPPRARPSSRARRVFVIEAAETMNDQAANRLLKTLEEPPSFAHLLLLSDRREDVLRDDRLALPAGSLRPAADGADRGVAGRRGGAAGPGLRAPGARRRVAWPRGWPAMRGRAACAAAGAHPLRRWR